MPIVFGYTIIIFIMMYLTFSGKVHKISFLKVNLTLKIRLELIRIVKENRER